MDTAQLFNFLNELKKNNNREWFNAHKADYQQAKKHFDLLVKELIPEINKIDSSIGMQEPKDCVFRIYRDIRFSKNKSPYKENFGAVFARGGRKSEYAGYYLHLEPGQSFIGGGLHRPPSGILKIMRKEIYDYPDEFKAVLADKEFQRQFQGITGEKLKKAPRDFPDDFPDVELLKYKSYTVGKAVSDETLGSGRGKQEILLTFEAMQPFIEFINKAIEFHR